MSNRAKGQDVELIVIVDGEVRRNFTFVRSTEFIFKIEIKEEGYLNETTQRYDAIFNGIRGKAAIHLDNPEIINFANIVVDKYRQRIPGVRVNMKQTINFPSGRRARIIIPDVDFGDIPVTTGGRGNYVESSIDYAASAALSLVV